MLNKKMKTINIHRIRELMGLHPLKIRNIYVFGSRVYGTNREDSDYDILVTACQMHAHLEIKDDEYNIHIYTPDNFKEKLKQHDIHALECVFAPEWAKLQLKEDYLNQWKYNPEKLQKYIHNQSYSSWGKGKDNIVEGYTEYGLKSIFHSLRMLMFAIQIANEGKIINYSEANDLHKELMALKDEDIEWNVFRDKYLPFKIYLEKQLKTITNQE